MIWPDLLHGSQCAFQRNGDLIRTAGGTRATMHTLHADNGILSLHILQQAADTLQIPLQPPITSMLAMVWSSRSSTRVILEQVPRLL